MDKIYFPYEIFNKLSKEESDKLEEKLMFIYFKEHPEKLNQIIELAQGDSARIENDKEQEFQKVLDRDYAFSLDILKQRKNDEIAQNLVEVINNYNNRISEN